MAVDPVNITRYDLSRSQLEEYILFCIGVFNKPAMVISAKLDKMLRGIRQGRESPFQTLRRYSKEGVIDVLKEYKISPYMVKGAGMHYIANAGLDLVSCTADDLRRCPGISYKTAHFFILHTRLHARVACLDTHVLHWFRDQGYDAPKSSPQSTKVYAKWQALFLQKADNASKTPAEFDLEIWREYSKNG
jgi:thermostable 8-oxoguanine DNA glycosylase